MTLLERMLLSGVCGPLQTAVSYQPFFISNYQMVYLSDPYELCNISAYTIRLLLTTNYFQNRNIEVKPMNIFDDAWFGTKILRQIFTSNFYVQTKAGFKTCGIGFIKQDEEEQVLEICREINLCGVVFRDTWKEGFTPVRINKETSLYSKMISVPNHLKIRETKFQGNYGPPGFNNWFYKMYRYRNESTLLNCYTEKEFLMWSWMPFLLPLCYDENNVSVNQLTQQIIYNYENIMHTTISLKFLIQIEKVHPIQLAGVTAILFGGHDLTGQEMCYGNFKYIYKHSIKQWITQFDDIPDEENEKNREIFKMYMYQNDWKIMNSKQKALLEVFLYTNECYDFYNLRLKWNANMTSIGKREILIMQQKYQLMPQLLMLMKFLDFG